MTTHFQMMWSLVVYSLGTEEEMYALGWKCHALESLRVPSILLGVTGR
jgi:hypothetical protein